VTVEAPTTTAAPVRRIPGETGTWVFLFGDMLVFAVFFATFMVERAKAPDIFDIARRTLHLGVGLANTLVLLTSSLFVVVALRALRSGARATSRARPSPQQWRAAESSSH
jgi:nitric oxide reductase NorE protein